MTDNVIPRHFGFLRTSETYLNKYSVKYQYSFFLTELPMQFNIANKSNQFNHSLFIRKQNRFFDMFQEPSEKSQCWFRVRNTPFGIFLAGSFSKTLKSLKHLFKQYHTLTVKQYLDIHLIIMTIKTFKGKYRKLNCKKKKGKKLSYFNREGSVLLSNKR